MRGYTERPNVISGAVLNNAGQTPFTKEFPMGEGWLALWLEIAIVLTVGTGTTPVTEGELLFVKNVLIRSDRGETLCNLPGRALYKIATLKNGATPFKDAIAAASATYRVHLPIYFADFDMLRPEDTILDTKRYNSISCAITLGSVADLLGTPGTASVACTLNAEIERSMGRLPKEGEPYFHINYDFRPPVDASANQNIDIERSTEMSLKDIYVHSGTSGTGGVPASGTNADTIIATLNIKDQSRFIEKDRIWRNVVNQNKLDSKLESVLTGFAQFDFCQDRSIASAMATGDKSVLQATWTNGTAPANSIVTLFQEAVRALK